MVFGSISQLLSRISKTKLPDTGASSTIYTPQRLRQKGQGAFSKYIGSLVLSSENGKNELTKSITRQGE